MKLFSLEHGEDSYEALYCPPALHIQNDSVADLQHVYERWAIQKGKTSLRLCFYERSETGVMNMTDVYEWHDLRPKPRVINKPVVAEEDMPF